MSEEPAVATEQPARKNPLWWGEVVGGFFIAVLIVITLGALAVYVLSGTDWGRERVRRIAQDLLQKEATGGKVRIGRVSGNLLTGMTINDFVITDSADKPFIAVKRITGKYGIGDIINRRIWANDIVLEQPILVLDRPPNGAWNYKRIFPGDSGTKTTSEGRLGWLDRMQFRNSRIIDGTVIVRSPWQPSKRLSKAGADSAVRAALSGDSRLVVVAAPGGYQKITEVRSIDAVLPLLRLSEPGYPERLANVSSLNALAFPFRPPPADIRDFRGQLRFTDDSVWWKGATVRLPNTVATGDGTYAFNSGDLTLKARSSRADFADMRWVYPRMPSSTRGSLNFDLKWREGMEQYVATNMNLTSGEARIRGNLGVTMTDTIAIHNTDLRFSDVSTVFLEQLIPDFKSPRRGVLTGRARVHGGRNALVVDGDVAFADIRAGTSRIIANGEIGFPGPGRGMRAENLHVRMSPFQLELARSYFPELPISGVITGTATLDGNTTTQMRVVGDIAHVDRGARSEVAGRGTFSLAGDQRFDIDAVAKPVSLITVGRFMPEAGLQGSASGPFTVRGTLSDLRVVTNLAFSGGGHIDARAFLDLEGTKRYDVAATMRALNLAAISTKGPETSLSGRATVTGTGTNPETMTATVAADLRAARWADFAVDTASVRATVRGGLAQVPWLYLAGDQIRASASGSFGLTRNRAGTLQYAVAVDSMRALQRWVPALGADSAGVVRPRPALIARAMQEARSDSAREARDTEVERIVTGKAPPKLKVNMPRAIPRDSAGGLLRASGTISGNIHNFDLIGRARGQDVALRGQFVRRFETNYAWMNARTPSAKLAVGIDADSLMVGGFALDSVFARVSYDKPGGHVDLKVVQDARRDYQLNADYLLSQARNELRVGNLQLRLDTALWVSPRMSIINWGGPGIRVTDFELRNRGNGRIYANGLLPTEGIANFTLAVDNLPVGNFTDLLESDLGLIGNVDLSGRMSGTLRDPNFRGAFAIINGQYQGTTLPDLRGTFGYEDRRLVTHVDALRNGGAPMATIDGRLPINLAFSGVTGKRLLDAPMSVDIAGDSLPVELIPHVTDVVSDVRGQVAGRVALRGRLDRPSLAGALYISNTSLTLTATGMHVEGVTGTVRMANDVVTLGSEDQLITGLASGPVSLRGTINVGDWRAPSFDLYLIGERAQVLDNQWGKVRADFGLALRGPVASPYLSGQVTITDGVIRAPEPTGKRVIGAGDPALFNVLDTAMLSERELFPPSNPLISNMKVEMTLAINRDTWVRNQDANVEVFTEYPLRVNVANKQFDVTGAISTERGDYTFLSKRFQITRGSAMFIGAKEIDNPTLQITGEYRVASGTGGGVDIKVLIGGTLKRPRLSLESDAQPPRSQSELISLLAFGQSTTSVGSINAVSSLAAGGLSRETLTSGAQFAGQQLAGIALGVFVDEIEASLGRALATDYFNVTPADVPIELVSGTGIGNFFESTRFEGGKYLNPRTFVVGQMVGIGIPGARIQYRDAKGWRYEASVERRLLLQQPTLSSQTFKGKQGYGAFIVREWKF